MLTGSYLYLSDINIHLLDTNLQVFSMVFCIFLNTSTAQGEWDNELLQEINLSDVDRSQETADINLL